MMYVTFLSAFLLSSVSAYYSIVGLTTMFLGAFWPVVIMGLALETAKLVTASWLYQNWKLASWLLRTYLTIAVIVLIMITSMGIFGFLAKSHIDSTQDNKSNATEIETIAAQQKIINGRLAYLMSRAEQISKTEEATSAASNRIDYQIQQAQKELLKLNQIRSDLTKNENALIANIGPLIYIAEMFYDDPQASVDKSVRLVIFIIMFVFDPLAVLLVIAANMLLMEKRRLNPPPPPILKSPPPAKPAQVAPPEPPAKVVPAPSAITPTAAAVVPTPTSTPTQVAAPAGDPIPAELDDQQMRTMSMTHNDILAAFKLFFDREPTTKDNLAGLKGLSSRDLLNAFYSSKEFVTRPGVKTLILSAAKKIQERKKS
jgi:hypothetical protein